jgi:hypothetical protein
LRHRSLIATEAVLLVGLAKDWITGAVHASSLPDYGKVLFVMGATIGILGGLYFTLEKLLARGVAGTHATLKSLPLPLPALAFHAVALFVLFLLYARELGLSVL